MTAVNVMSLTSATNFEVGVGEQALVTEYNTEPKFPGRLGPFPSTEVTNATSSNASSVEIKAP
jgi:hypothetical protein